MPEHEHVVQHVLFLVLMGAASTLSASSLDAEGGHLICVVDLRSDFLLCFRIHQAVSIS